MTDAREALQDAILQRLGIPTTDADIYTILAAIASAGLVVVPKGEAGVATSVSTWFMHDNFTYTRLAGTTAGEVADAALKLRATDAYGSLCPAIVLSGEKELRRVGAMVHFSKTAVANLGGWIDAVTSDPDIPRLLAERTAAPTDGRQTP